MQRYDAGTQHERKTVAQIVIETAPEPSQSLAFNYASEALNNGFFLDYLVSSSPHPCFVFSSDFRRIT